MSSINSKMASFDVGLTERLTRTMEAMELRRSFPSEWFKNNPGKRPPVELPVMDCSLAQVRSTVKHFLLSDDGPSQRLDADLVLLYFRKLADTMKARLKEDWTSFGITIGKAGSEVGPWDIVDAEDYCATIELELEPTVAAGPEDDLWILMVLASLYHHSASAGGIGKANRASGDVVKQWETAGFKVSKLGPFCKANSKLTDIPSYTKMIAVFDMFLFKFPDHGLAAARNLTSMSRFQGFAAYQSLFRLSKLIKKDFEEIRTWLLAEPMQNEYFEITRSGQELDQPHSYAPYFMVLQLAPISPYSEDANPSLYLFTNIVSATLKDRDSRYARVPKTKVPPNVPINAYVFAYTLTYGEERIAGLPDAKDTAGWYTWFVDIDSCFHHSCLEHKRPPKALIKKLQRKWSVFRQDRPGTIGHMLYHLKP